MASVGAWGQTETDRVALVVGNGRYLHAAPLPNPPADARAVAETLREIGFEVLEGVDLEKAAFEELLRQFATRVEDADVALFYYAGHGLQVYGRNYLAPVDAKLEQQQDLYFEAIDTELILRIVEKDSRTSLIFLDACRDNPLARNLARSMGAARSQAVGRGLAQIEAGIGTLIAYATQPNNVAYDGTGEHSPFTTAVLENIDEPGLEVRQMLSRVRENVIRTTGGRQVPWDHSSLTDDFYFVPKQQVAAHTPPEAPSVAGSATSQTEIVFWQSIQASPNPDDFRVYLEQFPNGLFAPLARNRLRALLPPEDARGDTGTPVVVPKPAEPTPETARLEQRELELSRREAELQERRDALEAEWKERLSQLDARLADREKTVEEELQKRASGLTTREQALAEQQRELDEMAKQVAEAREKGEEERQAQIAAAQAQLAAAAADRERLAREQADLEAEQAEITRLRAQTDLRRKELEALGAEQAERLALLEQDRAALERAREELARRQAELAAAPDPEKMAQIKVTLDARELELRQREEELASEQQALDAERNERLAAIDKQLAARQQAAEEELQKRVIGLESREQRLAEQQQGLERMSSEVAAAREKSEAERQAQIAAAQAQLAAAAAERERLVRERAELEAEQEELAALRAQNEVRRRELDALGAEQIQRLAGIEQDRAALEEARTALARREADLADAPDPGELAEAKAALDSRAVEIERREAELSAEQQALEAERSERLAALDQELASRQHAAEQELQQRTAAIKEREQALAQHQERVAQLDRNVVAAVAQDAAVRQEQLAEAQAKLAAAEAERERLAEERAQLEAEWVRLDELRRGDEARRTELTALAAEQAERLAQLERDRAALELAQEELEQRQANLAKTPNPDEIGKSKVELAAREVELERREAELKQDQQTLEAERTKQVAALDLRLGDASAKGAAEPATVVDVAPGPAENEEPSEQRPAEGQRELPATPVAPQRAEEAPAEREPGQADTLELTNVQPRQELEKPPAAPAVVAPALDVDRIDTDYVALKTSNVRAEPTTDGSVLGVLDRGAEVRVLGKVKDAAWYQIARPGGGIGYVHASLLEDREVRLARAKAAAAEADSAAARAAERAAAAEQRKIAEAARREAERAAAAEQREIAEAARRKAEAQVAWQAERAAAAEAQAARERLAAVQPQQEIEPREEKAPPAGRADEIQLTQASILGAWCSDDITFRLTATSWKFRMADGYEVEFPVQDYELLDDTIQIHWRDNQNRRSITEFGQFSDDQRRVVQIRGRNEPGGDWHYYNRPFGRC